MKTEIRVNGPLDVPRTLERYRVWGEDPVNRLGPELFVRAIRVAPSRVHPGESQHTGARSGGR
jgi:hypothetical protein